MFQKCADRQEADCGTLLETIFNESFFYVPEPGHLNLVARDSIFILDEENHLSGCSNDLVVRVDTALLNSAASFEGITGEPVEEKHIIILQEDDIPLRVKNYRSKLEDHDNSKYKCYFILKSFAVNNETISIHMEKLISNNAIKLNYRRSGSQFILIEKEIGKY